MAQPSNGSDRAPADTLGLYIHWPFCRSKCPYCDFNSYACDTVDEKRWRRALIAELRAVADATPGRTVDSVFFGGGTPSLMAPATVATLIDAAAEFWSVAPEVEITLEANPTTAEATRFRALRLAGVNRLSLGVQSLDDAALRFLGRGHDARQARQAAALAAATFSRMSLDLIYGRPGQTPAVWRSELAAATALAGDHVSVYQLTVEPGTPFHQRGVREAGEDRGAALFELTQELLDAAGLPAYEVSNHARPGAECRHNLAVWRGGDYGGVGPGAHARLRHDGRTTAVRRLSSPGAWLAAVEADGEGVAERTVLSAEERQLELILSGLRLTDGIDRERFRAITGRAPEESVDPDGLRSVIESGLVVVDTVGMRVTNAGRLLLDALLARLLA